MSLKSLSAQVLADTTGRGESFTSLERLGASTPVFLAFVFSSVTVLQPNFFL